MTIVYIIVALVGGFLLGRASKRSVTTLPSTPEEIAEVQTKARAAVKKRTEDRKDAILKMMRENVERHEELKACGLEAERKGIDRQDVDELLGVHEDTSRRYLSELESEGKIVQIDVGRDTYYRLAE